MGRQHISKKSIEAALIKCKGFMSHAAKELGIHRFTLYRYLEKYPELKNIHLDQVSLRGDDIVLAQYNAACGIKMAKQTEDGEFIYEVAPNPNAAKLILTYDHGYAEKTKTEITGKVDVFSELSKEEDNDQE